jgi:outer membrane protein OmpA-like peptidoglycan-associated protein
MRKSYLTILFALFLAGTMIAQPGKIKETWNEMAGKAELLMSKGSYYQAAEYYAKALELNSSNVDLKYNQAEALRLGRDYKRAGRAYNSIRKKVVKGKIDKATYPLVNYYYGLMMKQAEEYEEAEEALFQFIQEVDVAIVDETYKTKARIAYDGCQMARKRTKSIINVTELDALSKKVNSKYSESSAFVMSDGTLLFSSLKSDEPILLEGQTVASRLFVAEMKDNNKVGKVNKFGLGLPGGLFHVGSASVSSDGESLYLTLCEQEGGEVNNCNIFVSKKNAGNDKYDWGRPVKMEAPINSDQYENVTPFATKASDGSDVLYFSSTRPGGEGGMDIWAATGRDGKFDSVVNLGKNINTVGDELSPFIDAAVGYDDPRPILYFSSDGHPSYGGLDIQLAYKNNVNYTEWTATKNAGSEINSSADEYSFVLAPTKDKSYFVSNRVGGYSVAGRTCCDDVFMANLTPPVLEKIIVVDMGGKIFDENKKPRKGVELTLYDITTGKTLVKTLTSGVDGFSTEGLDLDKKYLMEIKVPGYDPMTYNFDTNNLEDSKIVTKDFYLKKTVVIPTTCLAKGKVFGDSGSSSKSVLSGANVKIYQFIGGKESLFKELITDAKGEFNIDLPKEQSYRIVASKGGYLNASSNTSTKGSSPNCSKSISLSIKEKRKNVAFKIENILYDFNSAQLRSESIPNLDVLLKLLNDNPSIIIELGSHTDSKGKDAYNQTLSQKRAQSVVDWLIGRGVTGNRLVAKGYGESLPLVSNTNPDGSDNPDNRQLNRRTEFKIIGDVNK